MKDLTLLPPAEGWLDSEGNPIQAHGGGMLVYNERYFWFGENRNVEPGQGNVIGISCYSSTDLIHWTHHGVVLPVVKDDSNHDLYYTKVIERPKVIYNQQTGQFVMILHIDSPDYKYARVGFAVCDEPTGAYRYMGSVRPNMSESRDMTVFQDEDGTAYLFYSSEGNATLHIARLSDDYLSVTEQFTRNFEKRFREAPAVFKYREKYFLISSGCTGWEPNEADYAIADTVLGPWTTIGNPCVGDDAEKTFYTQSTYVLPVIDEPGTFVFMADRWKPGQLWDSRYIWLPIEFVREHEIQIGWERGRVHEA